MKTITLTTDFGHDNWFAGTMKGVILSLCPDANIVDLNNGIKHYDINSASFSLAVSHSYFPAGTIHVVVVDPSVGSTRRALIAETDKTLFVAPDNGVLTPIIENADTLKIFSIENKKYLRKPISNTFHGRDVFAPVSAHLANGVKPNSFGPEIDDPKTIQALHVNRVAQNLYEGEIVWIDSFGNLITNINASYIKNARSIEILFATLAQRFIGLNSSYSSVPKGSPAVLIGSSGYLEIGINQGNAAQEFGLNIRCRFRLVIKQ